jgi:hypothetical protein
MRKLLGKFPLIIKEKDMEKVWNEFLLLCAPGISALGIIIIPLLLLFNWEKIKKWLDE